MAHLDLRNKEKNVSFRYLWLKDQMEKIRLKYSEDEISNLELKNYLLKTYNSRYQPVGRFFNNITNENIKMSLEAFINKVINEDYILSGYCTLFKNHSHKNIAAETLKLLLDLRKKYKTKMVEFPKGSDDYTYYKVLQLTYKVLANSYYGILGLAVSAFYNSFIQNSVTLSGQDIITTSITSMESFLGNNNKFEDLDDIMEFINNIASDKYKANIVEYVDEPVSEEKLLEYLLERTKNPIDEEELKKIINNLSDELRTRVFYKNQIMELLGNKYFIEKQQEMVNNPDGYKNDPELVQLICDFTFYDHILEDRFKRAIKQTRNSVIVVDTDLTFGSFVE